MKKWPTHEAYIWERVPFLRLLLPLVVGIQGYRYFSDFDLSVALAVVFISTLLFGVFAFTKSIKKPLQYMRFASLHIALIAAAWLLCYFNDIRNNNDWFANERAEAFIASVVNTPAEKEKTWKLEVEVLHTIDGGTVKVSEGKAFVYVFKDEHPLNIHQGDTIMLPDKWQLIKRSGNPFEFDYAAYCNRNNIYYQQFLAANEIALFAKTFPENLPFIQRLHNWSVAAIARYIKDEKVLGLMQAMLVGEEANMDADLRQAYSETGIIHIVAISGSHISFFFLLITFLLGWIKHKKWQWVKYVAAIPLVWVYVIMSGAPPSAVRAALMFSILGIGFAFDKSSHSLNHLLATAFILLCAEPMWLYAIGFQLSFVAVLSLILFYRPIYKLYVPVNVVLRTLWQVVAASIAAELLVAPLVVYYFHLFPLQFIVANVVAYLFMGFALIGGVLLVALSAITPIATLLANAIEWIVTVFNNLVYWLQHANPRAFNFLQIDGAELLLLYVVITGVGYYLLQKNKRGLYVGLVSMVVLLALFNLDEWKALHQRNLVVYNINKINHIELIDGKNHWVINTDTIIDERKKNYVLKPAHCGYGVWRSRDYKNDRLFVVRGKKILVLDAIEGGDSKFPIDYVIINFAARAEDIAQVQAMYSPVQIVLGNNISRTKQEAIAADARAKGINIWAVSRNGAFIL
ncbi:MAG TPA: ComEC/Rec2 family competence protein [Flavipsychrobacter sp.]|nr:ComEC/Rec2 family competence protein [Flavipsychrobacter sp.]